MGKLTDWIADELASEPDFNEHDITTEKRIRDILFSQIEDLQFSSEELDLGKNTFGKKSYILSFSLDFPSSTKAPYKFLFETRTRNLIPQYTNTHRVYKAPSGSKEEQVLKNLELYLLKNPENKTKFNPKSKRTRNDAFLVKSGEVKNDVVTFTFSRDDSWVKGKLVVYYNGKIDIDDSASLKTVGMTLVAYQNGDGTFNVLPFAKGLRISFNRLGSSEFADSFKYSIYNIPELFEDPHRFIMQATD